MSDRELTGLLKMRGVDTTRKTRVDKWGNVFYLEPPAPVDKL